MNKYIIVKAYTIEELCFEVNVEMTLGYKPLGGFRYFDRERLEFNFFQTMVKDDDNNIKIVQDDDKIKTNVFGGAESSW